MSVPTMKMNSGYEIPLLGLGTWKSQKGAVQAAVESAIDSGYRHIDCAWLYANENEIGNGIANKIKEGKVKRGDLFVTSKLWCTFHKPEAVKSALMASLKELQLDYLDLYLMHFPVAFKYTTPTEMFPQNANGETMMEDTDYIDTWKAMEALIKEGLVRSIGISNFNTFQVDRIMKEGSIAPAVNQVELHPYLVQTDLVKHCQKLGIVVTAYSPLGSGDRPWKSKNEPVLLEDPKLVEIASKCKKSVAQVIMRFQIQREVTIIPKSVTPSRIKENSQLFDFELTEDDMATITAFNKDFRTCHWFNLKHKFFPFNKDYSE